MKTERELVIDWLQENYYVSACHDEDDGHYITRSEIERKAYGMSLYRHADGVWSFGDTEVEVRVKVCGGVVVETEAA